MSSYLPQKTFVVCTMQMSPGPGHLLADSSKRNLSVIHSKKDAVMLTKVDLLLLNDFGCMNSWKGVATIGFFAGLVAGLAIAAAVAFSVMTLGVGAIIIGACAVAAVAATYNSVQSNSKKCNTLLTAWQDFHPTVKFDQQSALTQRSMLTCGAGGILKPFISELAANSASTRIAWANRGQVTLTGVISFMFGASVGYTLGTSGLVAAGTEVIIGVVGAYCIYAPLSYLEKEGIRAYNDTDEGGTEYDRMIDLVESMEDDSFTYDSADDDYNPTNLAKTGEIVFQHSVDMYRHNENQRFIDRMMNVTGTNAEKRAAREAIALEMKRTKSGSIAVNEMRRKGSGDILPRQRTQNKGNRVIEGFKSETGASRSEAIRGTKASGYTDGLMFNAVALLLPLLVTPLDEYTITTAASFAEEDAKNGISITSLTQ